MSRRQRHNFAELKRYWSECTLAVIVLLASALCLVWILRVPLLQNPDETSHIDYVFSLYSAGRLLNVRTPPSAWNVHRRYEGRKEMEGPQSSPYDLLGHQYTLYLIEATDFQRIRFHNEEKVASNYGTRQYYRDLDANAPKAPAGLSDLRAQDNPWLITAYPFFYYATAAAFLRVISVFHSGPVWLFFGARFLSSLFFAGSLVLIYKILLESRLGNVRALMCTAIVAFFPMTIFVSSSVQPDTLAMLLLLLCSYCTLRFRRRRETSLALSLLLGFALGALLVTKYHIFLFTALAVFATIITNFLYRRMPLTVVAKELVLLLLPSVLMFSVQLWIIWGGQQITGGNLHSAKVGFVKGIRNAMWDYYRGGLPFVSWWGTFGWMDAPLVFWSETFQARLLRVLVVLTVLILVLVFIRLIQVVVRLSMLGWRGQWRLALQIAFANPLIINHFLFSIFMVVLYALTDNTFYAQGRHWFAYTLSGILITAEFAPRALPRLKLKKALSTLLIVGLLLYCAAGTYFSLRTITNRYYSNVTSIASR